MTTQLALIPNTAQGPPTIQERLITRATDPATSREAARRVVRSKRAEGSLDEFLSPLRVHGEMTCAEAGRHIELEAGYSRHYWSTEFNKRVHGWHVAGHIELTGEERGGGRVWRIKWQTP